MKKNTNNSKNTNNVNQDNDENNELFYKYIASYNNTDQENILLREQIARLEDELRRLKQPPLMLADIIAIRDKNAVIKIQNGNKFWVNIISKKPMKVGDTVLVDQRNLAILDIFNTTKDFDVEKFLIIEKPRIGWNDIGGLNEQIKLIEEVIELPLTKPQQLKNLGIEPPKGILLYGPPGTGKTMLAKAVAKESNANFLEIVASELVQKFIGDGARLVKEIFEFARNKKPAIVFIDEIDALASKRIELGTSGEREVQRTFMQLLAEMDGFKPLDKVKIIAATNRLDILDPAILRPGRFDRIINIDLPDLEGRLSILKIHIKRMRLSKNVKLKKLAELTENYSGAELKAMCTEAGYNALRRNGKNIKMEDFLDFIENRKSEDEDFKRFYG